MGIAKSIEGYAVADYYTSNVDNFIQYLSKKMHADFVVHIFDSEYEFINKNETSFGCLNKFQLIIEIDEYKLSNVVELPTYRIIIPVCYVHEEELELTFYPNQVVSICFLTFEHLWRSFIEELQLGYDRQEAIDKYKTLRYEYSRMLKQVDIHKILITTHACYYLENIVDVELFPTVCFDDIIQVAKEKDNLHCFNFQHILDAENKNQLPQSFLKMEELKIVLLDDFKDLK